MITKPKVNLCAGIKTTLLDSIGKVFRGVLEERDVERDELVRGVGLE